MKYWALLILLIFSIKESIANPYPLKPRDYYVGVNKIYQGKPATLKITDEYIKNYRTRLQEALNQDVEFAGEYVVAEWGCGSSCVIHSFINKRTGVVLDHVFGGEGGPFLKEVYLNSRLVKAFGENEADGKFYTYYYLLEGNQLKLVKMNEREPIDWVDIINYAYRK
ncbi:hypothetical protein [Acinetobacter indicus]|uniref:hypothetical protein n=1 Tax=Acinetobacter indicus TaxID=756892 RepID=UPI001443D015|nr:hypothetical protein [Acinetobacter indicus]